MYDGFGQKSHKQSETSDLDLCVLKMSGTFVAKASEASSATLPVCGMMLSGRLYQLPRGGHPISENEYSSSPGLPTPRTTDSHGPGPLNRPKSMDGIGARIKRIVLLRTPMTSEG